MAISVITRLEKLNPRKQTSTIDDLLPLGSHYRHPDSALVAYPQAVKQALGNLPQGTFRIAIVGAGSAGIAALYELSQLARANANTKLLVTIYESDPDNFLIRAANSPREVDVRGLKAGRVSAAHVKNGGAVDTVYEVGAMRFPEIAGLTWHYADRAFPAPGNRDVQIFPNPGKVATEFVFGDQVDRYVGSDPKDWNDGDVDNPSRTLQVRNLVIDGLMNGLVTPEGTLYQIGNKPAIEIAVEIKDANTSRERLQQIFADWQTFIATYDGTALGAAVRNVIRTRHAELPEIDGLGTAEKINYYVELFGRFGFGTGGFKSLFNQSLVEMMRLLLWDYSNEYTLPVSENVEFIKRIYTAAVEDAPVNFQVTTKLHRVTDVFMSADRSTANICYYTSDDRAELHLDTHDYAVLAAPQEQILAAVSRAGYDIEARSVTFGETAYGGASRTETALPPLRASATHTAPNARIVAALSQLHMTRSAKVFGTIDVDHAFRPPTHNGEEIKAVISDSGLAASYIVPSPFEGTRKATFLASYTWDDDTSRLQHDLGRYPQNPLPDAPADEKSPITMFDSMIDRATRDIYDPNVRQYTRWWFSSYLQGVDRADRFSFDWSTNRSAGGFKIDMTGDHYQSNLCFRFHQHATQIIDQKPLCRFFLASDSYSHLGGWLEGAFMSAINAVAGFVVSANHGDSAALNETARGLFELDPQAKKGA